MTIRAVHLEVAHSLDNDSFLMALRRFIARRGQVKIIRSDNATNFTSGERELRECMESKQDSRHTTAEKHQMDLQSSKWVTFWRGMGTLHPHRPKDTSSPASDANYWWRKFVNPAVWSRKYNEWSTTHHSFNWPTRLRGLDTKSPASLTSRNSVAPWPFQRRRLFLPS